MTPQAQHIAIAEACGWDMDPIEARGWGSRGQWARPPKSAPIHYPFKEGDLCSKNYAPQYLNDLNAMHEAEGALTPEQQVDFIYELNEVLGLVPLSSPASYREAVLWMFCRATAAQRAEAFLRTIGKWDDNV